MKTISAHRSGGSIRVVVIDRWARARRSIRSMRRRGLPDHVIAAAVGIDVEKMRRLGAISEIRHRIWGLDFSAP